MGKSFKLIVAILLAFAAGSQALHAAVRVDVPGGAKGLSNGSVICMYQGSDHVLWIGTWDGLNTYDGKEYRTFKYDPDDPNTLSSNVVRRIVEETSDVYWVATDYGLNRLDKSAGTVRRFYPGYENRMPADEDCFDVIAKEDGVVFCSSVGWGLSFYDQVSGQLVALNVPMVNSMSIHYLIDYDESSFLIYTIDSKIFKVDYLLQEDGSPSIIQAEPFGEDMRIQTISGTEYGLVAVTEDMDVYVKRTDQSGLHFLGRLPVRAKVTDIAENQYGECFLALDNATVYRISGAGDACERVRELDGIILLSLYSGFQDILWVGSDGRGVMAMYDSTLSFGKVSDESLLGTPGVQVRSFYETEDGFMYIGTKGRGLVKAYADGTPVRSFMMEDGLSNNSVYDISNGLRPGHLLVASDGYGLDVLFPSTGRIVNLPPAPGEVYRYVYSICPDPANDCIWLGTNGYGLVRLKYEVSGQNAFLREQMIYVNDPSDPSSISNNSIFSVIPAGSGKLWLGTRGGGLNLFDTATGKSEIFLSDGSGTSLTNNDVVTLHMDADSTLWIGTSYGLSSLSSKDVRNGVFKSYTQADGLENNTIHAILSGSDGRLWLSTTRGISTLNVSDGRIVNFYNYEDLQSNEFSDGASFCSRDGVFFFGGVDGYNYFHPESIHVRDFRPEVVFTGFHVQQHDLEGFNPYGTVVLRNSENFFDVMFHAVDFIRGENCEYQYKLDNFNSDWVYAGIDGHATFTNVPAGNYELMVRCTNSDKVWSDEVYTLKIKVKRHWTGMWWAFIIYGAIGFIAYLVSRAYRRRKIDQMRDIERYEAKLNFFTGVSHEFSTPLTLIYGSGEYLLDNYNLQPEIARYLRIIHNNAARMQQLIGDLMEFRRVDTGKYVTTFSKVDVSAFLQSVVDNFSEVAMTKNLEVAVSLPESPREIVTDKGALEKILFNIISNAFKYTPDRGYVHIDLRQGTTGIELEVTNSGKGIKPSDLQKVFDRFEILDNMERQMTKGRFRRNGIGLALAKSLAEALGGDIMVSSEVDKYTTFTLSLPDIEEGSIQMIDPSESDDVDVNMGLVHDEGEAGEVAQPKVKGGMRILVVDDEKQLRDLISSILTNEGYEVIQAADGTCALDVLRQIRPDLIISDIIMPGMSGFDLLKSVKANDMTKNIPFIFLTFKIDLEYKIQGSEYGADAYLQKPFHPKHLIAVVNHILESRVQLKEYYHSALSNSDLLDGKVVDAEDKEFMEKVIGLIEENISDPDFDLEEISGRLYVSRTQLYRKVKAIMGISPSELVSSVKVHHAANLLRTTRKPVQEIMYESGFNNKSYFYRVFDKVYHMTPKQMRSGETDHNITE